MNTEIAGGSNSEPLGPLELVFHGRHFKDQYIYGNIKITKFIYE